MQVSALVGYAGGTQAGPGGKVCYFYADPRVSGREGRGVCAIYAATIQPLTHGGM